MDYSKLYEKMAPTPDGESPVRHRTGTVSAVNANGTVDLDLGTVVVPDVSVLRGAYVELGETVQVVVWAGDLLVLGAVALNDGGGPLGWLDYAEVTANQATITTEVALTDLTSTRSYPGGRRVKITGSIRFGATNVDNNAILRIKESTTVLQTAEHIASRISSQSNPSLERSIVIVPSVGGHTYNLTLNMSVGTGSISLVASVSAPAFLLIEDLGPA